MRGNRDNPKTRRENQNRLPLGEFAEHMSDGHCFVANTFGQAAQLEGCGSL